MKIIKLSILFLMIFTRNIFSQPYYFYSGHYSEEEFYRKAVWRVNLQTGQKELFYHDTIQYTDGNYRGIKEIDWDPEQQWVYCWTFKGPKQMQRPWDGTPMDWDLLMVLKVDDPSIRHEFPDTGSFVQGTWPDYRRKRVLDGIIYNKHKDEFYVSWSVYFDSVNWSEDYLRTGIYDASSFALKDTFHIDGSWLTSTASVSEDGSKLYVERWTYRDEKEVGIFSIAEKRLLKRKSIADIGFPARYKGLSDNKGGKYLLGCHYPSDGISDRKIFVYHMDKDSIVSIFPFPYTSDEYFSGDARYVILEGIDYLKREQYGYDKIRLGKIWIYESSTGKLVQKLNLPQDGKILLFDNYPNMLYYYLPKEERSINIDFSKFSSIESITPDYAYTGSGEFTLRVLGKNFTTGSTVHWNGIPKTTRYISDSILEASISASDIAIPDSVLITVKSADGMMESNGIMFYVLEQQEEASIPTLLDTLQARLKYCYDTRQLGDRRFYTELADHIRDAIRKYQRQDTIGCAQEIEEFYNKLRWEYQSKPKRNDKRYVSEQAYQILYPLAREIEGRIIIRLKE